MVDNEDVTSAPETEIVASFNDGWKNVKTRREESGWDKTARTCTNFFFNNQWPDGYKKIIEDENRPALTLNHVLGVVDVIAGTIIQNDVDLVVLPVDRVSDPYIAQMLTKLVKQIEKSNNVQSERKQQLLDGLITGVGVKEKFFDYTIDLNGKPRVVHSPSMQWYLDPAFRKPDYSDANELWKVSWLTAKDIKRVYGKKVWEQVKGFADKKHTEYSEYLATHDWMRSYDYANTGGVKEPIKFLDDALNEGYDIKNKRYRVIERFERRWNDVELYFDPETGDYADATALSDEERAFVDATIIDHASPVIHLTTVICDVLAEDKDTDASEWQHAFDFFFPYFMGGCFMGVVQNVLDAQMEINKSDSILIDILARTAKAAGVYKKGAFGESEAEVSKLLGKTGQWVGMDEMYDESGRPLWAERRPGDVSPIYERIHERNREAMRDISGATAPLEGPVQRKQSGAAKRIEVSQSTVRLMNIIDNYRNMLLMEGRGYVWMIQTYYTDERMVRIFGDVLDMSPEEITLNKRFMDQIANDVTVGEYDVVLAFEGKSNTEREATYFKLSEILQWAPEYRSVIVPRMFDMLPIPEKDKMKRELQQLQQQQMQMQAMGQMQQGGERRGAIQSAPRASVNQRIPQRATA